MIPKADESIHLDIFVLFYFIIYYALLVIQKGRRDWVGVFIISVVMVVLVVHKVDVCDVIYVRFRPYLYQ